MALTWAIQVIWNFHWQRRLIRKRKLDRQWNQSWRMTKPCITMWSRPRWPHDNVSRVSSLTATHAKGHKPPNASTFMSFESTVKHPGATSWGVILSLFISLLRPGHSGFNNHVSRWQNTVEHWRVYGWLVMSVNMHVVLGDCAQLTLHAVPGTKDVFVRRHGINWTLAVTYLLRLICSWSTDTLLPNLSFIDSIPV